MRAKFETTESLLRFQSLFYWISFFYDYQEQLRICSNMCFNPYFIGLASFIKNKEELPWLYEYSFNPYFIGLASFILKP